MKSLLVGKYGKIFGRALEILPGTVAWTIILAPAVGGFFIPNVIAYCLIVFLAYWFYKSFKSAFYSFKGYFIVKHWETIDWYKKWKEDKTASSLNWNDIKHIVIIPNYNESEKVLSKSLRAFANQKQIDKNSMLVLLAMEARVDD